jgi:hypothetical protein
MHLSWLLALLLGSGVAVPSGGDGRLAVLGDDGRVTVVSGDKAKAVTPPHPRAVSVAWAPSGDRLVVVEMATLGTVRPFRLIVRSLEKAGKPRQIAPSSQSFLLWREIVGLAWPQADLITVMGRIDPSTIEMAKIDVRSGALVGEIEPGKAFFWSPDGAHCAVIGWVPHFAPAPDFGDRVEIDGHEVYGGPKGNEVPEPLLWSPDGGRLAFVETHGDSRDLLIAPTVTSSVAALRRFSLAAAKPELLSWSDDGTALLARSGQAYVRLDAATGAARPLAASDLAASGFARYAAATEAAVRASKMEGTVAYSWWVPKGKTP